MGSGGGLGVVLNREQGEFSVDQALQGPVVQVDMARFKVRILQRFHINAEPVVLRSDLNPAGLQILYRLVSTPVPELELKGAAPLGKS